MKSPVSLLTLMVFVTLLSMMLRNEPALADECPAPNFTAARTFDARPGCSVSVAVGDFNGDGKADLVAGKTSSGFGGGVVTNVSVLLGNGNGTFQAAVDYDAGLFPSSIAVADLNDDGKPDLVAVNNEGVSVLLGKGDGTFQSAVNHDVGPGANSVVDSGLVVHDFNGDRKPDLAVAIANGVSVLLGKGDGTFQPPVSHDAGPRNYSMAVDDLNGDGKPDLAVASGVYDQDGTFHGSILVLLGKGDGAFQAPISYSVGDTPISVAVGDLNGDGKPDLAAANLYSDPGATISVLIGKGDGTFQSAVNYGAGSRPYSVAARDFNGDGKLDLAVANWVPASVSVLLGIGDGTFQAATNFSAGGITASAQFVAIGDFNDDGKPDLAAAICSGVSVLLNMCPNVDVKLAIARANNALNLSWPLPYTNFVLESAAALDSVNWQGVSQAATTNNGRCEVYLPLDQPQRYFRLGKP